MVYLRRRNLALLTTAIVLQSAASLAAENKKTVLQRTSYPEEGHYTEIVKTIVPAGGRTPLHEHPGIEAGYILVGGGTMHVQGKPDRHMGVGDSELVPPRTPHQFVNGPKQTTILSTYVLEDGKPEVIKLDK